MRSDETAVVVGRPGAVLGQARAALRLSQLIARVAVVLLPCVAHAIAGCTGTDDGSGGDRSGGQTITAPGASEDTSDAGADAAVLAGDADGGSSAGAAAVDGATDASEPYVVPPTPEKAQPCSVAGCPRGLECADDGVCITPLPACLEDADCADGQRCGLTGACLDPGECGVSADCGAAESCRAGLCVMGSDCGQAELVIEPVIPNVLVLLDISGSMGDGLDGQRCSGSSCPPSKMSIASQAMDQMTITYQDAIDWGLAKFPGDGNCGAPTNVIVPAPGQAATVASNIASTTPQGKTPINVALGAIQNGGYLDDPTRRNYVLFISDGGESCNGDNDDSAQIIADMATQGINTFVVGFGGGVDPTVLDQFALAGGVPNTSGSTSYFQANNASELETALGKIFGSVIGCDFALASPPDDPDMIWAFFDDVMVDRDTDDGWSLDSAANQVTFVGSSCEMLKAGSVQDIDIVFGCPEPVLE